MRLPLQSVGAAEGTDQRRDDQAVSGPVIPRATRWAAWAILLALAAFQAYAQRFVVGPDGVSYLDLSDAVVTGNWARLLNLYWSPLYPALIGIARAVTGVGAQNEIPVVHAVNFVCFAAMLAAFDYLLASILAIGATTRHAILGGRWAAAIAYGLFGAFALTMIPLELTTPDLLNAALAFLAFGAMVRLRENADGSAHAIVLGTSLGLAALAKSFMIPWAIVCFATVIIALRSKAARPLAIAVGIWLVFVVPWTAALSSKAGRFTFGDAGRLTYAWFVNDQDAPANGGVPPNARTPRTEAILPGVGITPDTSYTDPMWADPARWNALLQPKIKISDQLKTMKVFHVFYVESLAPLLFLILFVVVAPRGSRRATWWRGWIVYVPAVIGLFAYAMVLVTTRYVMPFVLASTLMLLATTPLARRMLPTRAFLGFVIPIALESALPNTLRSLWYVTAALGGVLAAVLVPSRKAVVWMPVAVIGMIATFVLFPPSLASIIRLGAFGIVILLWRTTLVAVRGNRTVFYARRAELALGLVIALLLAFRLKSRFDRDAEALGYAKNPVHGNLPWNIAQDLRAHGITPGMRVAVIGPHAESYWARTARLHIVASVPANRVGDFWLLPKPEQEKLLEEFAANGAQVAIATLGIVGLPPDSTWTRVRYRGRIRFLK